MATSTSGTDKPKALDTFLTEVYQFYGTRRSTQFLGSKASAFDRGQRSFTPPLMMHTLVQGEGDREEGCCVNISSADRQTAQTWLYILQSQSIWGQKVKTCAQQLLCTYPSTYIAVPLQYLDLFLIYWAQWVRAQIYGQSASHVSWRLQVRIPLQAGQFFLEFS